MRLYNFGENFAFGGTFSQRLLDDLEPLSDMREILAERAGSQPGRGGMFALAPPVADLITQYEINHQNISLLVMGTVDQGGTGCMCPENATRRTILRELADGDCDDLLLAVFSSYCGVCDEPRRGAAVCLTSGLLPSENILSIIRASQMPVIASDEGTFKLTSEISDLVAKLTPHDETKLRVAEELVGNHVDIGINEQAISSD